MKGSSNGVLEVLRCDLSGRSEEKHEKLRTVPADYRTFKTTIARTFVVIITGDLTLQD